MTSTQFQNPQKPFNPILHATSKNYYWKGTGELSIKTFTNGRSFYQTGHGHYAVEEGNYLLLNRNQEYSITIESDTPVESFCIFFPDGMIEEVYRSLVTTSNRLLEDPYVPHLLSLDFVEKTYFNDTLLAPALFKVKTEYMIMSSENMGLKEKLHEILEKLLCVHHQVLQDMSKLPALRTSTKVELYKRVHVGHDFMSAYYDQPISLAEIAEVACLSPNHFLRSYKQLFGLSPHQFLIEKRLQEAKKLLLKTEKSITDICFEIGFQSLGSFSWLFSQRFAVSPSQFRQKR